MACNEDFVLYIVDQCAGAGDITVRKMMGDYCIYCDGVLFGLVCDNNLYVKETDAGRAVLREEILRAPYEGAKPYFYIDDVDDRDYLEELIRVTLPALRKPEPRRNSRVVKTRHLPDSLDDVIPPGVVCSQDLRAFFVRYLGQGFRFKLPFQSWLRDHAGSTYRDAIEAYKAFDGRFPDM